MAVQQVEIRDSRGDKRFHVDNAILKRYGRELGPCGIAVYCALVMHADRDTQTCWPSHQTIADETGMSRMQVFREIKKLACLGLISIQKRSGTSYIYTLLQITPTCNTELQPTESDLSHTVTGGVTQSYRGCHTQLHHL